MYQQIKKSLPIFFIIFLTILIWHKILYQSFLGEGFYYFDPQQYFFNANGDIAKSYNTDLFARLIFNILPLIFKDNISYYFAFQLTMMVILNITIYYFIYFFSKNKFLSATAAILFLGSFIANFEMLGIGNYQRFAQRLPMVIPLLISSIQLIKYLENKKIKYFLLSISLFSLAVYLGHFSTFLLPFFIISPYLFYIYHQRTSEGFLRSTFIASIFIFINYIFIANDSLKPTTNIISFIISKGPLQIIQDMILQYSNMVIPIFIIEKIASISNPYTNSIIMITLPIIFLTFLGIKNIPKSSRLYIIYLTSMIMIPILLFLNLYLGKVNPAFNMKGYQYYFIPSSYSEKINTNQVKGDRYYLVPYIFISIIFSTLFWSLFKNNNFGKIITIFVLSLYLLYNNHLIWDNLDKLQPLSNMMKNYINFTKAKSFEFTDQSVILVPRPLMWPSPFIRLFYGSPNMQFYLTTDKEIGNLDNGKKKFVFDYDYKHGKVINLTTSR